MLIYRRLERLTNGDDRILDLGTKDGRYLGKIPGDVVGVDIAFELPLETDKADFVCRRPKITV